MSKYTRVRRTYDAICPHCLGGGYVATKNGSVACPDCKGTGSVERWLTEIVVVDEQNQVTKG